MLLRRIPLAALAVTSALALTGCGSNGSSGAGPLAPAPPSSHPTATTSDPSTTTLTRAQAADAVVSLADLGSGFEVDPDKSDDDSSDMGCLDDVDKLMNKKAGGAGLEKPAAEHEAQYKAATELGMPFVLSTVDSLRSTSEITRGFSLIEKALRTCHTVDTTDAQGTHTQLAITTDRDAIAGADDQVNLTAAGRMSIAGPTGQTITVPFYLRISFAQVGNDVALIGYGSMVGQSEGSEDAEGLATFGVARLRAVASGTTLPTAPDFGLRAITTGDILKGLSGGSTNPV